MSHTPNPVPEQKEGRVFWARWRANFLAGIVLVAPLFLTIWLIWSVISWIDGRVARLLPIALDIPGFLHIPGYGLVLFMVFTALVGWTAKNYAAARTIAWSERMLDQLPIVRTVYNGIKQIAETMLADSKTSFKQACLVEYPRKGIWAVAFISTKARGEVAARMPEDELMSVFLPTTPNPTSGFLLFVPRADVVMLDMTVEEAAKLVISAGLVTPFFDEASLPGTIPVVDPAKLQPGQAAAS